MKFDGLIDMDDLVDYWYDRQFQGPLDSKTTSGRAEKNSDEYLEIELLIVDSKIKDARYCGHGSVLSQGLAAMTVDNVREMTVEEAKKFDPFDKLNFQVPILRMECANLPKRALERALDAAT